MKKLLLFIILFLLFLKTPFTQHTGVAQFIENKGQLNENVDYKLTLNSGEIFFEGNSITYNFYEKGKISALKHGKSLTDSTINGH